MTNRNRYLAVLCLALLAGCTANTPPTPSTRMNSSTSSNPTPTPPAVPPAAAQDVVVTPVDAFELQAAIAKHEGKVVLVDYWATWCVPCIKAFPHTVALSRKYGDKPFVAMSVTVNSADELGAIAHPAAIRLTTGPSSNSPAVRPIASFAAQASSSPGSR